MASILLANTLEDLDADSLKKFQWHLRQPGQSFRRLSEAQLPTGTGRQDTATAVVDMFGEDKAVDVAVEVLGKMGKNSQAQGLRDAHRVSLPPPLSVSPPAPPPSLPEASGRVATSVPHLLVRALYDLDPAELTVFQQNLCMDGVNFRRFPKARVGGATIETTVERMRATLGDEAAGRATAEILRRMGQNVLAQEVEDGLVQCGTGPQK